MKIHGFVYLVVGTGVAIFSKIIGPKLIFFFFFGIFLGFVGIVKLILEAIGSKEKPAQQRAQALPHQNHYVTRHHRVTNTQQFSAIHCPRCGKLIGYSDNYCSQCGQRLR